MKENRAGKLAREEQESIWLRTDPLGRWWGRQWASKGEGGARKQKPTTLSRPRYSLGSPVYPSLPSFFLTLAPLNM